MLILKDIADKISELEHDYNYSIYEEDKKKYRIILDDLKIYLPEHDLTLRSGKYEEYNKSEEEYTFCFSFNMLFNSKTEEYLYEEAGSSEIMTVANYLNQKSTKHTLEAIENLSCEILTK